MRRYRFLLSFRWIVLTVFVAIAVVVMVRLGMWQLDRLHGRQEANASISARMAGAPVPLQSLDLTKAEDALWRQVTVTGTYKADEEVLIRNRSNNTAPGFWVMTPLATKDGTAIPVSRGWIPITAAEGAGATPAGYAPPAGEVTVTGLVQEGERQEGLEAADPASGKLTSLARVDLGRLQQQTVERLTPVWLQLSDQQPPQTGVLPLKVAAPTLDEGPHLNYAGQWFIYAALTVVVYPLAIRRAAKSREAKAAADAKASAGGDDDTQPAEDTAPDTMTGAPR